MIFLVCQEQMLQVKHEVEHSRTDRRIRSGKRRSDISVREAKENKTESSPSSNSGSRGKHPKDFPLIHHNAENDDKHASGVTKLMDSKADFWPV